jgi:hypothetical protein
MVTGGDLRADGLGVTVVEQRPGHGRRSREPVSHVATHPVAREHVFGKEPAETGLIDFADGRSHGVVIARPATAVQPDRSPSRGGGWKVRAPTPGLGFGRLNLTCGYEKRRPTACRSEEPSDRPRRLSRREGVMRVISSAGRGADQDFFGKSLRLTLALHPGGVPGSSGRQGGSADGKEERPEEETRQSRLEGIRTRAQGVREIPGRAQGTHPDGTAPSVSLGQPGARPSLLADWQRHPRPAERAWLGGQGHRPTRRRSPP